MTTREVHQAVRYLFGNYDHPIDNTFIFEWESDFFAISKSKYSVEVEVKVSRADFKKDFTHKSRKHKIFSNYKKDLVCLSGYTDYGYRPIEGTNKKERYESSTYITFSKPCSMLPNKFFYACPEGLITPAEVPAYAGLIYTRSKSDAFIAKPAPFLHKNIRCFDKVLLGKYYHRNNEVAQLLSYYLRRNNLTDQQYQDLVQIVNRMR